MSDGIEISPQTFADVERVKKALKTVEAAVAKKILRKSLRAGLKVVAKLAQENAPIKTGGLKKAIKVTAMKRKVGRIGYNLLPRRKYLHIAEDDKYYYPAAIEHGAKGRGIKARHFMKRAYEAGAARARDVALKLTKDGLDAAVRAARSR